MPETIVRGNPITLEATVRDVNGDLAAADTLTVSILNPYGTVIVSNATPTVVSTGRYEYVYSVAADAVLGAWEADWAGSLDAKPIDASDGFTVLRQAAVASDDDGIGPPTGSCSLWTDWVDLPCDVDLSSLPGTETDWQALILQAVSDTLYERSGRQFGLCSETARPVPCCRRHMLVPCSCGGRYDAIRLGVAPIAAVTSVKIDGVTLSSSAYRVDEYEWLVRVDGDVWPHCNDLSVASTEVGTFEVTWQYGLAVPAEGILSARLYACKLAEQMVNTCGQLSGQEESIVRDGVTINLAPKKPGESLGVEYVDAWLAQFNTSGGIFAPGGHRSVWRVGT